MIDRAWFGVHVFPVTQRRSLPRLVQQLDRQLGRTGPPRSLQLPVRLRIATRLQRVCHPDISPDIIILFRSGTDPAKQFTWPVAVDRGLDGLLNLLPQLLLPVATTPTRLHHHTLADSAGKTQPHRSLAGIAPHAAPHRSIEFELEPGWTHLRGGADGLGPPANRALRGPDRQPRRLAADGSGFPVAWRNRVVQQSQVYSEYALPLLFLPLSV